MVGAGVALAAAPDTEVTTPVEMEVELLSTESTAPECLSGSVTADGCGSFVGSSGAPTPLALASANPVLRPIIGPGGWLIGNGLDAAEDCEGNACRGGDGGLLWGNGGDGRYGYDGGNAGFLFGDGGDGGGGLDAFYREGTGEKLAATDGGRGGRGGFLFGNGGNGGDGGSDENLLDADDPEDNDAEGAKGGNGGGGGLLGGEGGDAGWGGDAYSFNGDAYAGDGGVGGSASMGLSLIHI